jgi:predicted ferric reductase
MKNHIVKTISTEIVTHDVILFTVEKPEGYTYTSGQATQVSVNTLALKNEKKPFTFSSLNNQKHLEFIIKIYNSHNGVTK